MVIFLLGTIFLCLIPTFGSEENTEIEVEVMIDFGNGIVKWAKVDLDTNKTAINATEKACEKLDLDISVIWSQWGAFVSKIDGKPLDYSWWWWFIIWNDTQEKWEGSMVGASSVNLNDGDVIGWSSNSSKPLATPSAKHPWPAFQNNAMNLGATESNGPETNAVEWIFDTETKELAASPVVAQNKVVINNWGGTFCLSEEGELLWKNSEVKGVFSPTFTHGKVLVGGKDGYLYSLNITNGEILWKTKITSNPGLSGVASPGKIVKGRIYLGSFDFKEGTGYLYCLKEEDEQVLWKNTTLSSIYFSSPSVTENRVFVGTMGLYNSTTLQWSPPYGVYCFDAKNGERIWNFSVNGSVGSSPTTVDDKVLFTSKNGYLYCLDSISGDLIWEKNIGNSVSSPAIMQNKIFVGSGEMNNEGKFYCLNMNGDILWKFEPNGAVQSSPAVAGNFVYFSTNVQNGTIYCLNISNGKLVWQFKPWPAQYIISSPAIVEGKLFIASDNGRLYCLGGEPSNITVGGTSSTEVIHAGEDVKFIHKDEENKLTITSIDENLVTLKIEPLLQRVEVNVGETKELDTDNNGKKDLSIIVNNVDTSSQSASLTFNTLAEPQDKGANVMLISLLVLIIIIIFIALGIMVNLKRRR
jgi:outer membrane protein assembly factor BamB